VESIFGNHSPGVFEATELAIQVAALLLPEVVATGLSKKFTPMQQTHHRSPLRIITLTVLIAVVVSVSTASAQQQTVLKEHYVLGPVRVFYIKEGKDAVPLDDVDRSGVPDRVEDISKLVWTAHHLFCEVLKFPDPFKSERYKGVTCMQVSLRDLSGGNGLAFSASQRARRIPEDKDVRVVKGNAGGDCL